MKHFIFTLAITACIFTSCTDNQDVILGRDYFYDVATNGHRDSSGKVDWVFTQGIKWNMFGKVTATKERTQIDGNYIYRFSPSCMISVSVQ